jgi:hypothetical protein
MFDCVDHFDFLMEPTRLQGKMKWYRFGKKMSNTESSRVGVHEFSFCRLFYCFISECRAFVHLFSKIS